MARELSLAVCALVVISFVGTLIVSVAFIGLKEREVILMAKRFELDRDVSQRMFTKNAQRVHPFNTNVLTGPGGPMRGGIRL